jgi:hypothetical protein
VEQRAPSELDGSESVRQIASAPAQVARLSAQLGGLEQLTSGRHSAHAVASENTHQAVPSHTTLSMR